MTLDELLAKHPTPWTAEPCGVTGCECRLITDSKGETVVEVGVEVGFDLDMKGPTLAPLFAAAPELLSVCELIRDKDRVGTAPVSDFLRDKIERAIAKARGASHE